MTEGAMALSLAAFSFLLTMIWGEPLLRVLRHLKMGESIRIDGPQRHFAKSGTPTMGGVLIVVPVTLLTILLNMASLVGINVIGRSIFLPLGTLILFAILGSLDDWQKLRGKRRVEKGMRARTKFIIQWVWAIIIAIGLRYVLDAPEMYVPLLEQEFSLGIFYIPVAAFLIVGISNAVNLTDGLDGLAGGVALIALSGLPTCEYTMTRSRWASRSGRRCTSFSG